MLSLDKAVLLTSIHDKLMELYVRRHRAIDNQATDRLRALQQEIALVEREWRAVRAGLFGTA